MTHEPKVIESKQVSNEYVAYRIICCDAKCGENCRPDAHICEDSWVTVRITADDYDALLEDFKKMVAERHAAMCAWREKNCRG